MKIHKPTGNKDTDRIIVDLQKQIDDLKKVTTPKHTILSRNESEFGKIVVKRDIDLYGKVNYKSNKRKYDWTFNTGGYLTSSSLSRYYYRSYPGDVSWGEYITTLTLTGQEGEAALWIPPAAGKVTKVVVIYDTTRDDEFGFHLCKAPYNSLELTEIWNSGAMTASASSNTWRGFGFRASELKSDPAMPSTTFKDDTTFRSATFSGTDSLYLLHKKTEHSGSATYYFSIQLSGVYT